MVVQMQPDNKAQGNLGSGESFPGLLALCDVYCISSLILPRFARNHDLGIFKKKNSTFIGWVLEISFGSRRVFPLL